MNFLLTKKVGKAHSNQKGETWVNVELLRLRSEIYKLRNSAEKPVAPHFSSDLVMLKLRPLNHVLNSSEKVRSFLHTGAAPLDHSDIHIRRYSKMISRRFVTRMHEIENNLSSTSLLGPVIMRRVLRERHIVVLRIYPY